MESSFEAKPQPYLAFPNGSLKTYGLPPAPAMNADGEYKDCLKNHAASLGGHAVDGCGEFTPSPTSDPAVPSSLTCGACGCHRNFHRHLVQRQQREPNAATAGRYVDADDSADEDDHHDGDRHAHQFQRPRHRSRSPPSRHYSASNMLLALSEGREGAHSGPATLAPLSGHGTEQLHRRRSRTKFSPEQKSKMHELSEKLGWRMPKRDDGAVEEFCRRIGVERGVFKVWMHNNKQTFAGTSGGTPTSRRAADGDSGGGGDGGRGEVDGAVGFPDGVDVNGEKFVVNGSPSSSSPS